jgi:UDP-GlcNAc:undecaprenyl-phosphate GlcNAc-1-phosphate transferase
MEALTFAIPFAVACGVALAATPLVSRLALACGVVDRPSERSASARPGIPLLGGLAVAAGFGAGLAAALLLIGPERSRPLTGLAVGSALVLALGCVDDRVGLKAWPKIAVELVAAWLAIAYGQKIMHFTEPVSQTTFMLPTWLVWTVSTLWIVGVTNSINLIDGLDGLASGVAAIIAATLALIAAQTGQIFGVCLGVSLVGALLGFLRFNFAPARIFLGDTGSLFVGYALALLALEGYRQVTVLTFVVPLLALAVPILDTALSIVRRIRRRAPIFSADRLHMHHRLLAVEGSHRNAVLQFYFLTACFCLIALSFTKLQGLAAALFLIAVIGLTFRLLRNLGALSDGKADDLPAGAGKKES